MKKAKRLLVLAIAVILCLSLCGCRQLDEMKASHATWLENGNILWNGNVYIPVSDSSYGMYYEYAEELNLKNSESVYITDPDVPVLLSRMLGTGGYAASNGLLIEAYVYNRPGADGHNVYCRADFYDWTMNALKNGYEIQEYGYYYFDYRTYEDKRGVLTDAQRQAIEDVLNNVMPITGSYEIYNDYYEQSLTITGYSMAHLFARNMGELFYNNGMYSLVFSYYDEEDNYCSKCYDVPDKYTALFDELFLEIGVVNEDLVRPSNRTTLAEIV